MRLPRASEIAEAAEFVFGESVHHDGASSRGRSYQAKCAYWHALVEAGYSPSEVARLVGADRHTINNGLAHPADREHIDWIMDRVVAQIGNET